MLFKSKRQFFLLLAVFFSLTILTLYLKDLKKKELETQIEKVELLDIKIGVGTSMGKLGTAIFGKIINNGDEVIKIATINVFFLGESGEIIKEKKFFPVNNFSFKDSSPLKPRESKSFGFPIDDLVPENWNGEIKAKLIDLKFK